MGAGRNKAKKMHSFLQLLRLATWVLPELSYSMRARREAGIRRRWSGQGHRGAQITGMAHVTKRM
jgi:hypothetical protein